MKFVSILINICLLVAFVNSHGYLSDPLNRGKNNGNQHSDRYYFTSGDYHICGNTGPNYINIGHAWSSVYIPNTQMTGPIQRTYKSGEKVIMKANFYSMHHGMIKVMLCKLNSSTDIVTQACFDQEILKISSMNLSRAVNYDDYTIRTSTKNITSGNPWIAPGIAFDPPFNLNFNVQLPIGLTCENCVIQFKWYILAALDVLPCLQADGSKVPILKDSDFERYESSCLLNVWRNCADIKIESDSNDVSQAYTPNPVKPVKEYPKSFTCPPETILNIKYLYTEIKRFKDMNDVTPTNSTDQYKFTSAGVYCAVAENNANVTCNTCRENCMEPTKICPASCYCYWFPRKQIDFQSPKLN